MVVDDEPGIQKQIQMAIQDEDTVVIGAQDSRSAIAAIEDSRCDLMLVKSVLPVSREPILVPMKPNERYMMKSSQSFLKKPFTDGDLKNFITRHIKK
jgi:DNA-binding NtrC family response regulator